MRVAFTRSIASPAHSDLWVHEFARNISTQLTFDFSLNMMATWSPDESRIIISSNREWLF